MHVEPAALCVVVAHTQGTYQKVKCYHGLTDPVPAPEENLPRSLESESVEARWLSLCENKNAIYFIMTLHVAE